MQRRWRAVLSDPLSVQKNFFIFSGPWYGPKGHPGCWDGVVTFDACCTLYRTTDRLSRYANIKTAKAVTGPGAEPELNV